MYVYPQIAEMLRSKVDIWGCVITMCLFVDPGQYATLGTKLNATCICTVRIYLHMYALL